MMFIVTFLYKLKFYVMNASITDLNLLYNLMYISKILSRETQLLKIIGFLSSYVIILINILINESGYCNLTIL